MAKKMKKAGIILLVILVLLGTGIFIMFQSMKHKTEEAVAKQVNAQIDMTKVNDGTYEGTSDGGMVYVEVKVMVKDHTIKEIKLLKHENGKGKPAEVIINDMVAKNTDEVDGVSGATTSSKTIRNAVNVALQKGMN